MVVKKDGKIYYWSFYVGHPLSKQTEWVLHDRKMPARDAKEAILLFDLSLSYYFREYSNYFARSKYQPYSQPNQSKVWIHYRRLIQYERIYTPDRGYTIHQYKKIAEHSVYSYLKLFGN
jgi:hypothetical protein